MNSSDYSNVAKRKSGGKRARNSLYTALKEPSKRVQASRSSSIHSTQSYAYIYLPVSIYMLQGPLGVPLLSYLFVSLAFYLFYLPSRTLPHRLSLFLSSSRSPHTLSVSRYTLDSPLAPPPRSKTKESPRTTLSSSGFHNTA